MFWVETGENKLNKIDVYTTMKANAFKASAHKCSGCGYTSLVKAQVVISWAVLCMLWVYQLQVSTPGKSQ